MNFVSKENRGLAFLMRGLSYYGIIIEVDLMLCSYSITSYIGIRCSVLNSITIGLRPRKWVALPSTKRAKKSRNGVGNHCNHLRY